MPLPFASSDRLLAHFERTGDPRSLGRLFDRTAPELLRIAAWLCGNRSDAEDLLQRTFLTVLTARGNYDADRRALPWLCGILGNHAKKLQEQRARRDELREPAGERDPAAAAADGEFAAAVARVRAELGAPYAEVLDLHLAEGLDAKRIAERLGRPAGTVRTQIVRGLELLRRHLPSGFVAGFVLAATAQAAALAAVRSIVVEEATAAAGAVAGSGAILTLGGVLMAKKILLLVPLFVLLVGGGAWALLRGDGESLAAPTTASPVAAQLESPSKPVDAPVTAAAKASAPREAAVAAPEIAAEPGFATLVVRVHWADDQSAAANVGVVATPWWDNHFHKREGLTDAQGSLVLHRILPGSYWLRTAFTHEERLDLAADAVRSLDLEAKRTGYVEGTVVDAMERPVAGARLWLSDGGPPDGFEVAHSGDDGRFRLSFREGQQLGARKAGHAPSRLRYLVKANPNLVLALPGGGGTVHGRVVDDEGRPIAGARVEVGPNGGWPIQTSTMDVRLIHPTAPKVATDERGEFTCEGIATGNTEVRAWASGFGAASVYVDVGDGGSTEAVVDLPRAAIVEGIVRDTNGRPVANADVTRAGHYSDFGRPSTETDAEGRYRLGDLPPGSVSLTVIAREGRADATIVTTAAATTTWNPIVAAVGRAVTGRVLGPDGSPLRDLIVGVVTPGQPHADPQTRTDVDGSFALRSVELASVMLVVEAEGTRLAMRPNVAVGGEPVIIALTVGEMPTAHLRGRVVDVDGKPLAAALTLRLPSWTACPITDADENGSFHRGPLPAGNYIVGVEAKGFGRSTLPPVHLEPGEDKTLPDIVLARAGRVDFELRGSDPAARGDSIQIMRDDGVTFTWVNPEGNKATAELPPGEYVAAADTLSTKGSVAFSIRSEQVTRATLTFVPAVKVTFECRIGPTSPDDRIQIAVRDSGGALVDSAELHLVNRRAGVPLEWRTALPPGTYTVAARASDGRTASTRATVADATAAAPATVATIALEFTPR